MKKKTRRIINTTIFSLIMILVFTEVGLRISSEIYLKNNFLEIEQDNKNSTVILTLGESSTAGLWVEQKDSYPYQLQNLLRTKYSTKEIHIALPIHMGHNTGQVSNRIKQHIELYKPEIIVAMMGYNNEWSFAESHITKFMKSFKVSMIVTLDHSRLFRLTRYLFLKIKTDKQEEKELNREDYIWGGPEVVRFPLEKWIFGIAKNNQEEFVKLWHHDMKIISDAAKENNITLIIMTYHINPSYLDSTEFQKFTEKENLILIRNDLLFEPLIKNGSIKEYVFEIDNWHPNKKGYELIANNLFERIVEYNLLGK
jgi:lysophospholipase L1-like esterase